MTETTEEKREAQIWSELHITFCNAIMAARHHQGRPMDVYKLCDVEQLKYQLETVSKKISSLESQLSNRDKEIEKYRTALTSISELELSAVEPNTFCENCENWADSAINVMIEAELIAKASLPDLQSKEEEA